MITIIAPKLPTIPTPNPFSSPSFPKINLSNVIIPKPILPPPFIPAGLAIPFPKAPGFPNPPKFPGIPLISPPKPYSLNLALPSPDPSTFGEMIKTSLKSKIPAMIAEAKVSAGLPAISAQAIVPKLTVPAVPV
jgi:hypothetical protein